MNVLDLFSGIGGFSLGLERAGMRTVAFCEYEEHARQILKKHWPDVEIENDIRFLSPSKYSEKIDVVTGGFPCQDLSVAGRQTGIEEGERSGLWRELFRVIRDVRPKYAIMENVSNLLIGEDGKWFAKLLGDLASIGFDAQWHCISVADIGGGHERKRIWIIAYPHQIGWSMHQKIFNSLSSQICAYRTPRSIVALLAMVKQIRFPKIMPDHRKLDGLSDAVDRLERIGNSIHPKIPEIIGKAIMQHEGEKA